MLLEVRRSSEEALEPYRAVERTVDLAVAPTSCRGRAGGRSSGTARGGAEQLVGVLAKLEGVSGAVLELWSGRTTPAEPRGLVGEDDPMAELET